MHQTIGKSLLAGASLLLLAAPALAASKDKPPVSDPRIGVLEQELRDVQAQLAEIKQQQADADHTAAIVDLKRSTSDQYTDINNQLAALPRASVDNGRLSISSADGRFSAAIRGLMQYDVGYIAQGQGPASVDLNSGSNFRRAQIALVGTLFKDWSYNFTYDFAGNGTEKSGYIYTAYLEYDRLKPFGLRIGAYAPPAGLEDSTGSADLLFPERPASADIARNIAGSPSRDAITAFVAGDRYFAAVSYTGGKVTDAATFDEQQAVVGRVSYLLVDSPEVHWLIDADGTDVFKLADNAPGFSPTPPSFSNGPELGFETSKTVNTGTFNADGITQWGVETGANWNSLYAQAGYFGYQIQRRQSALSDPSFTGWYALATWSLTGEAHRYDPTTASFRGLRPTAPLGSPDGFGAWELAARFSNIDLNDKPFLTTAAGGVSGGNQSVWTLGVNWYPTDIIKFSLNYDNIKVSHPNAPTNDITADAIVLRTQLAL